MPRSTRSATTVAQADRAVKRAEMDAAKIAKKKTLELLRSFNGELPPRPTVFEWNTDRGGSPIGVWRALVIDTTQKDLFFVDRRYAGPADDPEIRRAVPLTEPRHVYTSPAHDLDWLRYWGRIEVFFREAKERIAKGQRIPDSSETRMFKEPVALDIGREPLVQYGRSPFGG